MIDSSGKTVAPPAFLVTGANGFVGMRLTRELIERYGPQAVTALVHPRGRAEESAFIEEIRKEGVAVIEADLLDAALAKLPPPTFRCVFHLAACAETEDASSRFETNDRGTQNLIAWLEPGLRQPGARLVFTGTLASVDRDYPRTPLDETDPCHPRMPYGLTKWQAEQLVEAEAKRLGFEWVILRLCTIVGPGFRPGGMFGVFEKLLAQGAISTSLNWPGCASFLALDDLIRILLAASAFPAMRNQRFVLSNGEDPSFDEVLDLIAQMHGHTRERVRLPGWVWGTVARVCWNTAGLSWVPYRTRNFCWRVAHLIHDGLRANASKLDAALGLKYIPLADALAEAYGRKPPEPPPTQRPTSPPASRSRSTTSSSSSSSSTPT